MSQTCLMCQLVFPEAHLQFQHFKTEWHRFNLKRKMVGKPSISQEEYEIKFANKDEQQESNEKQNAFCSICKKSFGNSKSFANHQNSKKHKQNESNVKTNQATVAEQAETCTEDVGKQEVSVEEEIEEVDSDEWDDDNVNPIDDNKCLFCDKQSTNFYNNLEHMSLYHSFFIPDIEYCVDIEGLLRYLGEKITQGFMCVWCNEKGRTFYSADAARAHMLDKGHTNMIFEGVALAEYADFYDYSTSYPDADDENANPDQEVAVPELDGTGFELVLPSGKTIGHKSLMRYYKQSLNPNRAVVLAKKSDKKLHKVLASYRALGWTGSDQANAARRAKDIHCLKRIEAKYRMKLGIKGNKLQTHFRAQVNF